MQTAEREKTERSQSSIIMLMRELVVYYLTCVKVIGSSFMRRKQSFSELWGGTETRKIKHSSCFSLFKCLFLHYYETQMPLWTHTHVKYVFKKQVCTHMMKQSEKHFLSLGIHFGLLWHLHLHSHSYNRINTIKVSSSSLPSCTSFSSMRARSQCHLVVTHSKYM